MISSSDLMPLWNEGFAFCLEYDGKHQFQDGLNE